MRSFNDIHDFDDAGRASHFDNTIDAAPLNRATLLLPVELNCSPILSLSSAIDPSLLRQTAPLDEDPHFSAFLSVARFPLILADTGRQPGGSAEFQSNAAFPLNSKDPGSDAFSRSTNGLGLHMSEETKDSNITVAVETQRPIRSRSSSLDGLFGDFADLSSDYLVFRKPFEELGDSSTMADRLMQNDFLVDQRPIIPSDPLFSGVSSSIYCSLGSFELPQDPILLDPPQGLIKPSSRKEPPNFPGLVADINMFDKETSSNVCVRPQDLMGDLAIPEAREPGSPRSVKVEDTLDDSMPVTSNPTTPKYLNVPQPDWPQIPTEHLPFIIEQYLAHFAQDAQNVSNEAQGSTFDMLPGPPPTENPRHPYTPITAEILEAVEESRQTDSVSKQRKKLADKTNASGAVSGSRTGANIMDMYETLVPQDVTLEKAFEGVPAVVVVQKTRYFLMMHPGERLSEDLLFSFAGRLNTSGQQIPGYRCYVQGCSKTTKRKDHMADHVRTHLGEKPFQCSVCGMGFIRNNDCQRHENNHRPDKKFVCVCKAAFSRRDLFVRHQKTVCSMTQGVATPGCFRRPRRTNKALGASTTSLRKGSPDGDDTDDLDYVPGRAGWVTAGA